MRNKTLTDPVPGFGYAACNAERFKQAMHGGIRKVLREIETSPTIDAEPVRHEGNTTFVTTDNLDAYADRIIVVQGNWCKVYYRDSDDTGVEGCMN